jgi:hypothetical protein
MAARRRLGWWKSELASGVFARIRGLFFAPLIFESLKVDAV